MIVRYLPLVTCLLAVSPQVESILPELVNEKNEKSLRQQQQQQSRDKEDAMHYFRLVIDEAESIPVVPSSIPIEKPSRMPQTRRPTGRPTTIGIAPFSTPEPTTNESPITEPPIPPVQRTGEPTGSPTASPTVEPTNSCNASPSLRELLIRVVLNSVSSAEDIDTPGSPQNEAFQWIVNEDTRYLCPDDPDLIQRYSLAVFYYSTSGDRWIECTAPTDFSSQTAIAAADENCNIEPVPDSGSDAWLTPSDECQWGGVVCNPLEGGSVERIDFEKNGLSGTLPSELKDLSDLRFFILEDGVISGVIPAAIGALTAIEIIDLNFNLIGGSLPSELFGLSSLTQLDLNDNLLTGSINTRIGDLANLAFLQVQNNQLTGTIPTEIGVLLSLGTANFEENNFEGIMPEAVCELRQGVLTSLTADCLEVSGRPSPPYVSCDCCTQCF